MKWIVSASIALAALILAGALLPAALPLAALALALGALWIAGAWRGWPWAPALGLAGALGLGALGALLRLPALALLTSACLALVAWDLAGFARRIAGVGRVAEAGALARAHVRRALAVTAAGWVLGAAAVSARVRLGFDWALLLGLLAVFSLWRVMRWRRAGEE